jgi:hypothetical protein
MRSKIAAATVRWTVTALALVTVLALVFGVQPRTLVKEVGVAPIETGVCFLCDGSISAAAVAPAAEIVIPTALATIVFAALLLPVLVVPSPHPERDAAVPPLPPPRA